MSRATFIAAALVACGEATAHAQTPDLDAARTQILQMQIEQERQRLLADEREAYAARDRLRTELTLNTLSDARAAMNPPPTDPLVAAPAYNPADQAFKALAQQQAVDAERILQLQEEALARSNARLRALQAAP